MPRVLVIGLDPYRVPGPWDPEPVASALRRASSTLAEAGVDATDCLVPLDGSADPATMVREALDASGAAAYDVVLVGGGLRHDDELVELFEDIVALVHARAPEAALVFNRRPDDVAAAVQRGLSRRRGRGTR